MCKLWYFHIGGSVACAAITVNVAAVDGIFRLTSSNRGTASAGRVVTSTHRMSAATPWEDWFKSRCGRDSR